MRLSKEHGLNPTIAVCVWCGEEKNEITLLGAAYKGRAPMHMVIDDQPCDACKAKLDSLEYVAFDPECQHRGLIRRTTLMEIVVGVEIKPDCKRIRFEKCPKCLGMMKGE